MMIEVNPTFYWAIPCVAGLLWFVNRWHEKKVIREASKILSPIKQDALMEAPKSKLQANRFLRAQLNHDKMPSNLKRAEDAQSKAMIDAAIKAALQAKAAALVKPAIKPVEIKPLEIKPVAIKPAEIMRTEFQPAATKPLEAKPAENRPQATPTMQGFNPVKPAQPKNNMLMANQKLDETYDEILEEMAKRAALRKHK